MERGLDRQHLRLSRSGAGTLEAELAKVSDSTDEAVEIWHQIEETVAQDALSVFMLFGASVTAYDPK